MKSQDTAELFFNNVKVPKANLLGDAKGGFSCLMNMLAQERLTNACGAVAAAEAALQVTIDYVSECKAFDQPISHFQSTRFKLAEMRTQIDVAQVFVDRCVTDHNEKKLTPEVAAEAKLFITELLCKVVHEGGNCTAAGVTCVSTRSARCTRTRASSASSQAPRRL